MVSRRFYPYQPGLTLPKGNMVSHDFIFDGILKWCCFDNCDLFAFYKPHLSYTFTKSATAFHFRNQTRFSLQ